MLSQHGHIAISKEYTINGDYYYYYFIIINNGEITSENNLPRAMMAGVVGMTRSTSAIVVVSCTSKTDYLIIVHVA